MGGVLNGGEFVRIDTLFVTPHFLCLIEIKNNLGNLDFEDVKRQCIRITSDEKIESLIYPVDHISASKLFPNIIKATKYRAPNCECDRNCKSFYHNWLIKHILSNYIVWVYHYFLWQQLQHFGQQSLKASDFQKLLMHLKSIHQDQ